MGILLFVLNVYFLALENDKWVSWPAKIMASPFNCVSTDTQMYILHGTSSQWGMFTIGSVIGLHIVLILCPMDLSRQQFASTKKVE